MHLIRVLSFIWDLRFNVRGEHVLGGWGRGQGMDGAWWLPDGGIRATQGTFSSFNRNYLHVHLRHYLRIEIQILAFTGRKT